MNTNPPRGEEAIQPHESPDQFPFSLLLVEDNEINQEVASEALAYWGCNVEIAANGQEAMTLLQKKSYDLIFMDCQMPIMDGYEATKKIRNEETSLHKRTIPIVAMTAHAMPADKQRCLAAGMDDYMSKPFTLDDIKNCLQRWASKIVSNAR